MPVSITEVIVLPLSATLSKISAATLSFLYFEGIKLLRFKAPITEAPSTPSSTLFKVELSPLADCATSIPELATELIP